MALHKTEEAIMDLLDAGLSPRAIVRRGFAETKVTFVLSTFGHAGRWAASDKRERARMRQGSADLLQAIQNARRD